MTPTSYECNVVTDDTLIDKIESIDVKLHPRTSGDSTATRERLEITNISEEPIDLQGKTLEIDGSEKHRLSRELEPGASLLLVSQGTGSYVQKSNPPNYIVDLRLDELLLIDKKATIRIIDDNKIVLEKKFTCPN